MVRIRKALDALAEIDSDERGAADHGPRGAQKYWNAGNVSARPTASAGRVVSGDAAM